jgi:hypothetical protein
MSPELHFERRQYRVYQASLESITSEIPSEQCGMRRRVYPADPTLIFGYEQHDVPGFGQQHDWIDGVGAYSHSETRQSASPCRARGVAVLPQRRAGGSCAPSLVMWRRVDGTTTRSDRGGDNGLGHGEDRGF